MPRTPYPIDGIVYDVDGNAINSAVLYIFNLRNHDSINTTTDTDGTYLLDMANATKEWVVGDPILIRAWTDGPRFKLKETQVTMSGSSLTQNLTLVAEKPVHPKHVADTDKSEHQAVANAKRIMRVDKSGNEVVYVAPTLYDYYFEVGENAIPNKQFVHKFGRNPDIDAAFEAIWNGGGDYTGFNAIVAETIEVYSDNAADAGTLVSSGTATGGSSNTLIDTGATFVSDGVAVGDIVLNDTRKSHGAVTEVTSETTLAVNLMTKSEVFADTNESGDSYRVASPASTGLAVLEIAKMLDGDFDNETEEFIILNGTTPVDTVGTYIRCSRMAGKIAGNNQANVGIITARQKTTTANVFAVMPAGYNQSMVAAYTIPINKEGHMTSWFAGLANKKAATCNVRLLIRHRGEVFNVKEEFSVTATGTSYILREYKVPKNAMPGGTDVKIMADTDTADTALSAGFDLVLSID